MSRPCSRRRGFARPPLCRSRGIGVLGSCLGRLLPKHRRGMCRVHGSMWKPTNTGLAPAFVHRPIRSLTSHELPKPCCLGHAVRCAWQCDAAVCLATDLDASTQVRYYPTLPSKYARFRHFGLAPTALPGCASPLPLHPCCNAAAARPPRRFRGCGWPIQQKQVSRAMAALFNLDRPVPDRSPHATVIPAACGRSMLCRIASPPEASKPSLARLLGGTRQTSIQLTSDSEIRVRTWHCCAVYWPLMPSVATPSFACRYHG